MVEPMPCPISVGRPSGRRAGLKAGLLLLPLIFLLTACSGEQGTGPADVRWDRDNCERCRMVLSSRNFSAQIRRPIDQNRPSQVHKFDDIGCALIWLDQQEWREDSGVEIWVNDHRDGEWIDARTAYYVPGKKSPMEYGLGAQDEPIPGALDFEQARALVYQLEEKFNSHGAHLEQNAEQAKLPSIRETNQP